MGLTEWLPSREISSLRGAWPSTAQKRKGTPNRGSYMQNCRVDPGILRSREGTTSVGVNVTGKCTEITNWVTPSGQNLVLYLDGVNVQCFNQTTNATTTIYTVPSNTRSVVFAPIDIWIYFCGYDVNGVGTFQVQIFDGVNTDTAFRGPVALTAAVASDGGVGQSSIGQHFLGVVYQNRTGFSGVPSTTVGSTPISITLTTDSRLIFLDVTLPALSDGGGNATMFLIMTTSDNAANWFFIPTDTQTGSIGDLPVPFNTPTTLHFVASLSDGDINASADSANSQFLLLTQAPDGTGPFMPNSINAYGQRMCYVVNTTEYISDISNAQSVTGDQNFVTMPNQRSMGCSFPLPGSTSLIITGDRWTAYTTDNSDVPATWSQPVGITDALGAPFAGCICPRTAGNYAWVATEAGLYLFNGVYDERPITYFWNPIWRRVNWKAAYAVKIADDIVGLKVYCIVPLDGATEPNYMFCIDYQNVAEGALPSYETVDISLDVFTPGQFSAVGIVKEQATDVSNLWIGPTAPGPITHLDTTTHNDLGAAVNGYWESGLVRNKEVPTSMLRTGQADVWARGNGNLICTLWGPDHQQSEVTPLLEGSGYPVQLTPNPGIQYALSTDMSQIENFTWQFQTNAVDEWFELSAFSPYMKADLTNR